MKAQITMILAAIALVGCSSRQMTMIEKSRNSNLPRGDYGFTLGGSLSEAEENARIRGFQSVSGTNVSVKPDEWRDFTVPNNPEISSITMFLDDGKVTQVSIIYTYASLRPSFKDIRQRLRNQFGKEVGIDDSKFELPIYLEDGKTPSGHIDHLHNQSAFWSDCKTVIKLEGRTRPDSRPTFRTSRA